MQIIDLSQPHTLAEPLTVALGYFDSIHVGHQALIAKALSLGRKVGVFTFVGDFYGSLGQAVKPIFDWETRKALLADLGVDYVLTLPAEPRWLNASGEDFLALMPYARAFVCGTDFRFGRGAECDTAYLADYCTRKGLQLAVVDLTRLYGVKVSTRHLRQYLKEGDIPRLNEALGRPYALHGQVVHGKELGNRLGFPTANFFPDESLELPLEGVYAAGVTIDGKGYQAVCNLGKQPTVGGEAFRLETCILGYDGDLYDRDLTVRLYERLRDIVKFDTVDELKAQIALDVLRTKEKVRV